MSYVSPKSGRQYVIVTVPGDAGGLLREDAPPAAGESAAPDSGGYVIAYRLP